MLVIKKKIRYNKRITNARQACGHETTGGGVEIGQREANRFLYQNQRGAMVGLRDHRAWVPFPSIRFILIYINYPYFIVFYNNCQDDCCYISKFVIQIVISHDLKRVADMLERIKALCKHAHITITELERNAGLGRSTIRFWDDHPPAVDKVAKVARYFDVSVDYLIGNTNNPLSHKSAGEALYDFVWSLELLSRATHEVQENLDQLLKWSAEGKD